MKGPKKAGGFLPACYCALCATLEDTAQEVFFQVLVCRGGLRAGILKSGVMTLGDTANSES